MFHNLFPIPVGFYNIDREITKNELNFIEKQEKKGSMFNRVSVDKTILKYEELKEIKNFIENCVANYLQEVFCPKNDVKLKITQSWLNYTEKGESHHAHYHLNSLVSGVFYIQTFNDKITFLKNLNEQIAIDTEKYNIWNSKSWWFPVETGKLILFPSSLTHKVDEVEHDITRISLAFNTFPVGSIGNDETSAGLVIKELDYPY